MSKIAVVYWSGTGNTEAMANAIADGARNAGAELACDSVICQDAPDDEAEANCRSLGAALT